MNDDRLNVLTRLMDVSVLRQRVHAGNLANQNTPGYAARAVEFESTFNQMIDEQGVDGAMEAEAQITTPHATPAQPDGNDVSVEHEVAAMAKNSTLYNAYLAMAKGKMKLYNTAISPAPGG